MLPKTNRLIKEEDFRKVFRSRNKKSCPLFDLFVLEKENSVPSRFGFIVSNKISKKAVLRNRAKRLLRESVKGLPEPYFFGYDFVLSAKHSIVEATLITVKAELDKCFKQ